MGSQAKHWCFTLNNWTYDDISALVAAAPLPDNENPTFSYLVFGRELGESGTPHLQGFFSLCSKLRLRQCKALAGLQRAHLQIARGTPQQAATYCKKDGDFDEYGTLSTSQGKRSDWERLKDHIKDQDSAPTLKDLGEIFPSLVGRYPRSVQNFVHMYGRKPTLVDGPLRPWQRQLDDAVNLPPDDRSITFVVDENGKSGKSWLTRYWFSKRDDMQRLSIGKRDDLAYAIDVTKRLFIFDIPRGSMEFLQYSILEQLKDQMIFSPKYESQAKILSDKVHVIVFSNEHPDRTKMTDDRYKIINIRQI